METIETKIPNQFVEQNRKLWLAIAQEFDLTEVRELKNNANISYMKDNVIGYPNHLQYVYTGRDSAFTSVLMKPNFCYSTGKPMVRSSIPYDVGVKFPITIPAGFLYDQLNEILPPKIIREGNLDNFPKGNVGISYYETFAKNDESLKKYISAFLDIGKISKSGILKQITEQIRDLSAGTNIRDGKVAGMGNDSTTMLENLVNF